MRFAPVLAFVLLAARPQDSGFKLPIQDFTPYLLVKMLERLESIEASLDSINSSMTDFWNSKYNS